MSLGQPGRMVALFVVFSSFVVLSMPQIGYNAGPVYAGLATVSISPATSLPHAAEAIAVTSMKATPAGTEKLAGSEVHTVYFAEGYTGSGPAVRFGESLDVLNTSSMTATGMVQYFIGTSGMTRTVTIAVPGHSRLSWAVEKDVGVNQTVSALVELDHSFTVTRTITRTTTLGQSLASSFASGAPSLSQFWYFAEGYTGSTFQEYLALLNPGSSDAHIMVQLFGLSGASPAAPISVTVPAHSRGTLNVRSVIPNRSIGLLVTSDQSIAAERVLYWGDGTGSGKFGASVSSGIRGPAPVWTFPYVSTTNGDQLYVSFTDPSNVVAHVNFATYGTSGPLTPPSPITIQPGTRTTLLLISRSSESQGPIGIVARSDVPIVGEQAQYFGGSPNIGSHTGSILAGAAPATQWSFAGFSGNNFNADNWYVLNTGTADAHLTATVYGNSGDMTNVQRTAGAGQLTRIAIDNAGTSPGGESVSWASDVPVSMVHVLRDTDTGSSASVTGGTSGAAGP